MGKRLAILLVVILTLGLTETKARGSIIEEMMFSNKEYAKNVDMETYLISEDKLAQVLSSHWDQKITQERQQELIGKPVYLVVSVTNKGKDSAWGLLSCRVDRANLKVYIHTVPFKKRFNYMIPLGEFNWGTKQEFPEISVQWEKLYTK